MSDDEQSECDRLQESHPLRQTIDSVVQSHWNAWGASHTGMELLERDGDLEVYRTRLEQNGAIVDPVLAVYSVRGVTAQEATRIFWDPDRRRDWEPSLECPPTIIERLRPDTLLLHQVYKRVWPADQRDVVFWSSLVNEGPRAAVVNYSTEYHAPPLQSGRRRMSVNVGLVCETIVDDDIGDGQLCSEQANEADYRTGGLANGIDRRQVRCRLQYCASIHPGGWAPAGAVRQVAKREFPRFLRRFGKYCADAVSGRPVELAGV